MKIIWCMVPEIWSMTDKFFCPYGLFFALLQPRKSKFSKNKKWVWGIILHKLTINDNNMMYGFSGMKHDRHFGLFFSPFTSVTSQKIKILKKWKNSLEISCIKNVPQVYQKSWSYAILFLRYGAWPR